MPTSNEILHQLASDFDELARRVQKMIEMTGSEASETENLVRVRDAAIKAARVTHRAAAPTAH